MCYFPLYRLPVPEDLNWNKSFKRFGYVEQSKAFIWDKRNTATTEKISFHFRKILDSLQTIPCGQCMECRIKHSRELAQRALAESTLHEENYFITLTYDDEHLPVRPSISRQDLQPGVFGYLKRDDLDNFIKNLRRWVEYHHGEDFMVFPCGEYGSKTGRPHFHLLCFGLSLKKYGQLEYLKNVTFQGKSYTYLTSPIIQEKWGKGFITIGNVEWDSCAYVARYVTKKMIGKSNEDYERLCLESGVLPQPREFQGSPRRPGMGLRYYDKNKDKIYEFDKVVLPGGLVAKPCKYYDNKFDIDDPELLAAIKEKRKENAALANMNKNFGKTAFEAEGLRQLEIEVSKRKFAKIQRGL